MIFDQYSRYKACSDLLRQTGFVEGDSVLDIGSGPECLFGEFMSDATMNYVDPLIPPGAGQGHITGNIFASELNGLAFDCVTAVDVLEHVPPEHRQAFLERLSSLGKNTLILGFPTSDSSDALDTDKAIDDQYRAIFGHDYSWLEEHYRFGLPALSDTVDKLQKLGWHCQTVGHGHSPWLKELLGFVICTWEIPSLKEVVLDISEQFNRKLYSYDYRAPYYRQFIIASRNPLPPVSVPTEENKGIDAEEIFQALMEDARSQYFIASIEQLTDSISERDAAVSERDAAVSERDAAVSERDAVIAERNAVIAERDAVIAEWNTVVALANQMKHSASWRLTRPLRFAARLARYGLSSEDRQRLTQGLRHRYHRLPLPTPAKGLVSFTYHKVFGKGVSALRRSVLCATPFYAPTIKPAPQQKGVTDYIVWGVIDWHFRHQRPQQLALALADAGRRVFYVSPNLVDDERAGFEVEALDASGRVFQVRLFVKGAPVIYSAAPNLEIVNQLRASIGEMLDWADCKQLIGLVQHSFWCDVAFVLPNSRLVYDCMDHHEGFGNTGETLMQLEKVLFEKADLTITTSAWLDQSVAELTQRRALVRNAGEYEYFSKIPDSVYCDPQGRRIIGYYGAIAEWFDLDLVEAVAKHHPECCVLLIGADTVNARSKLGKLPNVMFTGEVPYNKLPYYLYSFDVCLLPFKVIPLTLATNPVKAYEYLSAGKPVVTVDLPEMTQFDGLVYVAADQEQFLNAVDSVLARPESEDLVQHRKIFAQSQTWKHRADALIQHAESTANDARLSVIVITYNNLELTRECLTSLDEYSQYDNMEIIVVDNASSDGTPDFLENWASGTSNRKLILNDDNRGFAAANNQGLNIATGDYLVLLNNDTYVTPGWVRTLIGHLQRDKTIGLIGPVTNNIGNEAKIDISYSDMSEMLVKSASYTRRRIAQLYPLRTAAFFCVMMSRDVFEQVGPLDEIFGRGFFEDDDYCRRVEKLGLRVVCAEDVFIHHQLSASFNKLKQQDRQKLFEENKKIYETKWGEWIPHVHKKNANVATTVHIEPTVFLGQQHLDGQCNVCGKPSRFFYQEEVLWRESLNCEHCRTTSRYRSISQGILRAISELTGNEATSLATLPRVSKTKIHVYDTQPPFYYEPCAYPLPDLLKVTGWVDVELSQYKPKRLMGEVLSKGVTNQNLECLTFADESLDIVITSDVMEHVRLDDHAHKEIYRVLKPGGIYIFTVPHNRAWDETLIRVQITDPDDPSKDIHLLEPEYHGDTNSDENGGVLAYRTYGRDIEGYLSELGFEVEYSKEDIEYLGVLNTELYYCRKGES
ncbi:glycosyltransferase [Methylobacter sp.]|uniref:glycosyltransferase n=1 Tax=Methylobacter sp. TaxID=2051955 RepID=UPI00248A176F|nr:glycosyltransferase [Methylobacter sp.]MDI1276631.1 glycosyltransferase [Methylobacter sp.]MDI1357262.1 glycosyltransferase [Methylobacter sp.]